MADFRKLRVWDHAHQLGVTAEKVADKIRNARTRSLCDQVTRAARSISANIVEGSAHESSKQKLRYLQYALASTSELEEHVQMARDINAMSYEDFSDLMARIVSVRRQLHRFMERIRE